ncbi:MAG: hypothetical protein M3336_15665, partial [Chloroflexota bacterium]|nr:hypothetical protein [Chloroflexota bacterium]
AYIRATIDKREVGVTGRDLAPGVTPRCVVPVLVRCQPGSAGWRRADNNHDGATRGCRGRTLVEARASG